MPQPQLQQFQHDRRSSWADAPAFVPIHQHNYASFGGMMQQPLQGMGMPVAAQPMDQPWNQARRTFSNTSSSSSGSAYDTGMADGYKNAGSDAIVDPRNLFCKVSLLSQYL